MIHIAIDIRTRAITSLIPNAITLRHACILAFAIDAFFVGRASYATPPTMIDARLEIGTRAKTRRIAFFITSSYIVDANAALATLRRLTRRRTIATMQRIRREIDANRAITTRRIATHVATNFALVGTLSNLTTL